ncbi:MAG: D-glycero-beta-D-manno-heptose 1-phosphate adenylyltransferase [Ignavibacteria bacterium]|jgi:rfaE bifunctional protein nucleotidyltransferase chain/domain|nr:D-glycero-beta-D-manno-heptose 1-phosphate adenylyltransferase [Ignavibacteria bacterium]
MITDINTIINIRDAAKQNGQTVVFTNGCFDIIHPGHCKYLTESRKMGDILIIGLNSDASIGRIKGNGRPVNPELDRAFVLDTLKPVDYVVIFEEDTPFELISQVLPDVLVKGNDYAIEDIIGADVVIDNGGVVRTIPLVAGKSTTSIISRMVDVHT